MGRISYSLQALADLERISGFLLPEGPAAVLEALGLIDEAISVLPRHPFIGRPVETGFRELVISHGKTGYVALYSDNPAHDSVLIFAIRHQREAGFRAPGGVG